MLSSATVDTAASHRVAGIDAKDERSPATRSSTSRRAWLSSPFAISTLSGVLFWAALPPLNWWPLAWIACVPWLLLVRPRQLSGRRPYLQLWASGLLFWLVTLYWLTLPHWSVTAGWLALSIYIAVYTPLFVGLVRVAKWRCGISPVVGAPVVWVGLELARAHGLTGFLMGVLSHTQSGWIELLQIGDLAGAYAVSGLLVLSAACIERMLPSAGRRQAWWPATVLAIAVAATLGYGDYRIAGEHTRPGPRVALIQGSIDSQLNQPKDYNEQVSKHYLQLSQRAVSQFDDLDLVVWPEAMFRSPWREFGDDFQLPPGANVTIDELKRYTPDMLANVARSLGAPLLVGIEAVHFLGPERTQVFNSAVGVDESGHVTMRYDKCHLVPFGEFIPFAESFPWLYNLTPVSGSAYSGTGPAVFESRGVRYAPSICYESTVPHLFREHITELGRQNREPDVLVNLTNDGWFWGSTELDLHLACSVFRAIEARKPILIAANTGFSAWIDADGRIVAQGPRRQPDVLLAQPELDTRRSLYLVVGDWPAAACLAACLVFAGVGFWTPRRASLPEPPNPGKLPAVR